jgi:hypothetical protein
VAENPYPSDAPYDIVVKDLAGNIDALARADVAVLVDTEAGDCLVELMAAQTRLDAAIAKLSSRVERSGVWRGDGSRSASAWLERRTGRHRGECRAAMRRGKHLAALSEVAAAFENGRIGAWHVDQIARLHRRYPTHVTHDQARFVAWARELDHDGFAQVLAYWRQAVDPDGVEHDATDGYSRRRLDLSDGIDGVGLVDLRFEPIGWATFVEALRRIEHELWEHDWADARHRLGDAASSTDLARTDSQRRYDALIEMATRSTTAPAGGKRPRPLVTVHVDHDTLAGRICQLSTGTVLTPGQVLPVLCDCDIERAVYGAGNRIIDLGRTQRFFVGGTRRAVEIMKPTCAHPNCRIPSEHCQIDHNTPWDDGGRTDPDNGQPLCPHHQRHKTEQQRKAHRRRRRPRQDDDSDEPG